VLELIKEKMLRKILALMARMIQLGLLKVLLILIYFLGFGLTWGWAFLFNRKRLGSSAQNKNSAWYPAQGYAPEMEESLRQS